VLSGGGVSKGGSVVGPLGLMLKGAVMSRVARQRIRILTAAPSADHLEVLRVLIEAGKIKPAIDRSYPLSEAAEAIRYLEQDHARAKVVVTI
jgi:NADPH:quinone reductase-like Zn-dependent oxidoreductase